MVINNAKRRIPVKRRRVVWRSRAPADLTVTRLVRNLPPVWGDQEKQLGFA